MSRPKKLPLANVLDQLPLWAAAPGDRDAIRREVRIGELDHHPEWSNVYSKVEILLTTHDADGVTELDLAMAKFIDAAALQCGAVDATPKKPRPKLPPDAAARFGKKPPKTS